MKKGFFFVLCLAFIGSSSKLWGSDVQTRLYECELEQLNFQREVIYSSKKVLQSNAHRYATIDFKFNNYNALITVNQARQYVTGYINEIGKMRSSSFHAEYDYYLPPSVRLTHHSSDSKPKEDYLRTTIICRKL